MIDWYLDAILLLFVRIVPCYDYYMCYLIHATPVYPSLCLQFFSPSAYDLCSCFTIATIILLLLLLLYCCHHIVVTTDKLCQVSFFSGVVELTTQLLRLINILCSPCVESINLGFTSLEDCCDPLHLWVISHPILNIIHVHVMHEGCLCRLNHVVGKATEPGCPQLSWKN